MVLVLCCYIVLFENLHFQLPRYEIDASKRIFPKSCQQIFLRYQTHQEHLPNEYLQSCDDEYGHHHNAQVIYNLRAAGGSFVGNGDFTTNWDGIFLDAGLRDISVMGQTGSSHNE